MIVIVSKTAGLAVNSVDHDQRSRSEASDLGQHCLLRHLGLLRCTFGVVRAIQGIADNEGTD